MANISNTIRGILKEGQRWKPAGYDLDIAKRRDYYRGDVAKHITAKLAERFPQTWQRMSAYPIALFKHFAEQQATIYRAAPRRDIMQGGNISSELTDRALALYEGALADNRLQKVEQIAAAARICFIRIATDLDRGRLDFSPRWPDTVHVIPDPNWPTDLQRAYGLIAEITSSEGVSDLSDDHKRFEIWIREADGWRFAIAVKGGSDWIAEESQRWPILPWVAVPYESLEGCLYERPPGDDLHVINAISLMYSDLCFTIENQSFTQLWYSGPEPDKKLVGGSGTVWNAGEGGTFGSLTYQPQIASVKETAETMIGQWLALHNLSPTSASVLPDYQSGTALKIKREPAMNARLARVPVYREIEEMELWPIVRELGATLTGEAFPDDAVLKFTAGDLQLPLDDEAEFRISQGRVAANVSSWPREMVRLRLASTVEEAEALYMKYREFNAIEPVTVGIPFIRGAKVAPEQVITEEAPGNGEESSSE